MKTVLVLAISISLVLSTRADIYNAAKNQAHRAVDATEAATARTPDSLAPQTAPRPQAPMDPALAATMQNITSLRADLNELATNAVPASLTNNLMAAAMGTKPSAETVAKLAADLQAAMAGKAAFKTHCQKLAQDLHAAANGAHLSPAQFQFVSDDVEKILTDGGASYEAATSVLDDLKHLARETK